MTFLRNAWYVAAFDDEVGRALLARTLLGDPVVLDRSEDENDGREPVRLAIDMAPMRSRRGVERMLQAEQDERSAM